MHKVNYSWVCLGQPSGSVPTSRCNIPNKQDGDEGTGEGEVVTTILNTYHDEDSSLFP